MIPTQIDTLIITNLPAFYKIKLYNAIACHKRVFVIYTGDSAKERNADFFCGEVQFDHMFLTTDKWKRLWQVYKQIGRFTYDELILGGWDSLPYWLAAFVSPKQKNAVVVESSYLESVTSGWRGWLKRVFISRFTKVYASGASQRKITDRLGFHGETIITKGVGLFNYVPQPAYMPRRNVCNFLYVGRLASCKNLRLLIEVFNEEPGNQLHIVGFGPLEAELKSIAGVNIHFLGVVNNRDLPELYQKMDVFVLPSRSEPWGLVVEEALNNGLPVIVSNRVGCAEEIVSSENGLIFQWDNSEDLKRAIREMQDVPFYNSLRKNISEINFEEIKNSQVNSYL